MTEPADRLLARGDRALAAARRAADADDAETAADRAYYAMFVAASALLASEDVVVRRHSAVHAAFGERFVKNGRIDASLHRSLLNAFDLRQLADDDPMVSIAPHDARRSIQDAQEFVTAVRQFLAPPAS